MSSINLSLAAGDAAADFDDETLAEVGEAAEEEVMMTVHKHIRATSAALRASTCTHFGVYAYSCTTGTYTRLPRMVVSGVLYVSHTGALRAFGPLFRVER